MYIALAQLLTATLALSSPLADSADTSDTSAVASSCYPKGGCKTCEEFKTISLGYHGVCDNGVWKDPPTYLSGKFGHFNLVGGYESEKQCHDSWQFVMDCYSKSKKNGGKVSFLSMLPHSTPR